MELRSGILVIDIINTIIVTSYPAHQDICESKLRLIYDKDTNDTESLRHVITVKRYSSNTGSHIIVHGVLTFFFNIELLSLSLPYKMFYKVH